MKFYQMSRRAAKRRLRYLKKTRMKRIQMLLQRLHQQKKYNNDSSNAVSMIGEYSDIMKKYADFADKIDKLESKNMSASDYK